VRPRVPFRAAAVRSIASRAPDRGVSHPCCDQPWPRGCRREPFHAAGERERL